MADWNWLNENTRLFLSRGYLSEGETVEQRYKTIATVAESRLGMPGFAERFLSHLAKGWISLSSPVISNYGTNRGFPISCFGSFIGDSIEEIGYKAFEVQQMTKAGGGTSGYFGKVRARGTPVSTGGYTDGPVHFMEQYQTVIRVTNQGDVRRGAFAAYLDVDHPDIHEFLNIREEGNALQHISFGVCISDSWLESMLAGDKEKQEIWRKIIVKRYETGYPYIFFTDNVNNNKPQVYKENDLKIYASNLCSEICEPTDENSSFVCCLASQNLLFYEDWKDTEVVRDLVFFLDTVISEFIDKAKGKRGFEAAVKFAEEHRALGVGGLGWHSYLQSHMIPFESMEAKLKNGEIWKRIKSEAEAASVKLAKLFGEPKYGGGRRNSVLMAIAPTTSSAFILGQVSPSIEPLPDNYHVKDLQKGKFTYKNPYLEKLLIQKGKNTEEIWREILLNGGSVQSLDFLSEEEKNVFKTFDEISPKEIIIQAATRQKYIDQSQSLNLKIHPDTPLKEVSNLLIEAWRLGIKTLYYQRSTNLAQKEVRNILSCASCEA